MDQMCRKEKNVGGELEATGCFLVGMLNKMPLRSRWSH